MKQNRLTYEMKAETKQWINDNDYEGELGISSISPRSCLFISLPSLFFLLWDWDSNICKAWHLKIVLVYIWYQDLQVFHTYRMCTLPSYCSLFFHSSLSVASLHYFTHTVPGCQWRRPVTQFWFVSLWLSPVWMREGNRWTEQSWMYLATSGQ